MSSNPIFSPKRVSGIVRVGRLLGASLLLAGLAAGAQESRRPRTVRTSNHPIVDLRYPVIQVQAMLRKQLSGLSSTLARLDPISFSARTGAVRVSGAIITPASELFADAEPAPGTARGRGGAKSVQVEFNVSFLPSVRFSGDGDSWVTVHFQSVTVNGQDFLPLFPVAAKLMASMLADDRFSSFIENDESAVANRHGPVGIAPPSPDLSVRVDSFLRRKNIRIREADREIDLRLKLDQLIEAKTLRAAEGDVGGDSLEDWLAGLRLWRFGPEAIRTDETPRIGPDELAEPAEAERVFRLVIGKGRPSDRWEQRDQEEIAEDRAFVANLTAAETARLANPAALLSEVDERLAAGLEGVTGVLLSDQDQGELKRFKIWLKQHIKDELDATKSPLFFDDPENQVEATRLALRMEIDSFISHLARRADDQARIRAAIAQLPAGTQEPVVELRVGQGILNSLLRNLRAVDVAGKPLFREVSLDLRPDLPGLEVRGYLQMNFGGWANDLDQAVARALNRAAGDLVEFSVTARTFLDPKGILRVSLDKAAIGTGEGRIVLRDSGRNGHLLLATLQRSLAQAFAAALIPLTPTADRPADLDTRQRELIHTELLKAAPELRGLKDSSRLVSLLSTYDSRNPYAKAAALGDTVKAHGIPLKQTVRQDQETLLLNLDPGLVYELLPESLVDRVKFWNLRPTHSPRLDRCFFDLAVGLGESNREYAVRSGRASAEDDRDFHEGRAAAPRPGETDGEDMRLRVHLPTLTQKIEEVLKAAQAADNATIRAQLAKNEESGPFTYWDEVKVSNPGPDLLEIRFSFTEMRKVHHGKLWKVWVANWGKDRWQETDARTRVMIRFRPHLVSAEDFAHRYHGTVPPLFLGPEVLELDLVAGGYETNEGFLGGVLSLTKWAVNHSDVSANSYFGKRLKPWVMKKFAGMLEDPKDPGNTRLGSFRMNRYLRLFVDDQILALQLNPRMLSPGFDLHLVDQAWAARRAETQGLGFKLDPGSQRLTLDLAAGMSLTGSDRAELVRITHRTDELLAPFSKATDAATFIALASSDGVKEGLDPEVEVLDLLRATSVAGALRHLMAAYPGLSPTELASPKVSKGSPWVLGTGLELMFSAIVVDHAIRGLNRALAVATRIQKAEPGPALSESVKQLVARRNLFRDRWQAPLLARYQSRYHDHNAAILATLASDWTERLWWDAIHAETAFRLLVSAK